MKPFSIISKVRLKKAVAYLVLPALSVLVTIAITTDLFNTQKKAKALPECTIDTAAKASGGIPSTCEGEDVIIDGPYTVDAGQIKVIDDPDLANRVVCNGTGNITCDSKRKFKSLVMKNGVILTHAQAPAKETSVTLETTGTDRWIKVDIELTGNLELRAGSRIDVDGKGYPGGVYAHPNGYGPKGGYGIVEPNGGNIGANGGWHKGSGGRGWCNDTDAGECPNPTGGAEADGLIPANSYSTDFPFDFGSAGGHANQLAGGSKMPGADGGAGGGRIRIHAGGNLIIKPTSRISADGITGGNLITEGENERQLAGAGAGGSVFLSANEYFTRVSDPTAGIFGISAVGGEVRDLLTGVFYKEGSTVPGPLTWSNIKHSVGSDGILTNDSSLMITDVYARGGYSNYFKNRQVVGAGGGGGEVRILDLSTKFNLYKYLEAFSRGGAGSAFNPYALQVGDQIVVNIEVTNLTVGQTFTVEDKALRVTSGTGSCVPIEFTQMREVGGSFVIEGTWAVTGVTWNATANTTIEKFKYNCEVE